MRFFLVISIWIIIVGGLWGYITQRDLKRLQIVAASPVDLRAAGTFSIQLTPTFSTEADPFALTTTETPSSRFQCKLNGSPLSTGEVDLQRGKGIRYEDITGMLQGHNEIYVEASPPLSESNIEHGVRVRLYQDQTLIVDKTVWSSLGAQVSGTVSFSHQPQKEDEHDH